MCEDDEVEAIGVARRREFQTVLEVFFYFGDAGGTRWIGAVAREGRVV